MVCVCATVFYVLRDDKVGIENCFDFEKFIFEMNIYTVKEMYSLIIKKWLYQYNNNNQYY